MSDPSPARRRAGVCLHLTSLPGPRGIGELGRSALGFLDWMQAAGLGVWQFLPTGPTGYGDSPYQPLSVFAGNPLLIDLDELVEIDLLRTAETQTAGRESAQAAERVDYARVRAFKQPLLELAAARFEAGADAVLRAEFEHYCAANDAVWLDNFAVFSVLKAINRNTAWPEWHAQDRTYSPARLAAVATDACRPVRAEKLIQFLFARQWAALRDAARQRDIQLFGDVPIYLALDCAEAWSRPDLLLLGADCQPVEVAGVPPDYFSEDGQLWGNPVYRWDRHEEEGYAWWIARLRHVLGTADFVRLDHFRGFDAYWSVPGSASTARDGRWNPGPGARLLDAVAAAFGRVPLVAEDLGVITESVTALRKAYALPGMQVLQFLVDRFDFEPAVIEQDCVCYTGTHDNDTSAGWYAGSEGRRSGVALERAREAIRLNVEGAEESIHKAMITLCFNTAAQMAVAPLQDYLGLGSRARLNTPGVAGDNWRWRVRLPELENPELDWIPGLVRESGRA